MAEVYVGRKFKTILTQGSLSNLELAGSLVEASHKLNELDLTPENAGNLSVRTEKGMLITIGGKNKGELTTEDITEVTEFDGATAHAVGNQEPSSETPMHWLIYQKYPSVNAVIHVHDQKIVDNAEKLGLPLTGETHYGTDEQAQMVLDKLDEGDYVVIREHGIVTVAENLDDALQKVVGMHNV